MTAVSQSGPGVRSPGLSLEQARSRLAALLNYARPSDGWATVFLLALNLMVIVWSVEQADWVPTPNLIALILLAMLTGLALARIPVGNLVAVLALLPAGAVHRLLGGSLPS